MKFILLVSSMILALQAASSEITVQEHNSFHNTNYRPSIQIDKQRKMYALRKIDEKQASKLVMNETGETIINQKLIHQGMTLFYDIRTKNYHIELNALDGTIIKKVKR